MRKFWFCWWLVIRKKKLVLFQLITTYPSYFRFKWGIRWNKWNKTSFFLLMSPSTQWSPQESSSYRDQRQALFTSSPSTQHSTSSSSMGQTLRMLTRTPSNPSAAGQKKLPMTHTSLHNSKPNTTSPQPSTTELVVWKQLPRDRGGVTIGTNFHFPPFYGLPSIPKIPENPEDYEQ